ncbi:MAG: PilZ domain-containing protein [Gammaproteobacteria bacterium]
MSKNNRQFPRQEIQIEVELHFLEDEPRKTITRDLSQGGLFLLLNNSAYYTMGEMISLNFKNPLEDYENTDKDAIIVRQTDDGIAVAFIEIEDF